MGLNVNERWEVCTCVRACEWLWGVMALVDRSVHAWTSVEGRENHHTPKRTPINHTPNPTKQTRCPTSAAPSSPRGTGWSGTSRPRPSCGSRGPSSPAPGRRGSRSTRSVRRWGCLVLVCVYGCEITPADTDVSTHTHTTRPDATVPCRPPHALRPPPALALRRRGVLQVRAPLDAVSFTIVYKVFGSCGCLYWYCLDACVRARTCIYRPERRTTDDLPPTTNPPIHPYA